MGRYCIAYLVNISLTNTIRITILLFFIFSDSRRHHDFKGYCGGIQYTKRDKYTNSMSLTVISLARYHSSRETRCRFHPKSPRVGK